MSAQFDSETLPPFPDGRRPQAETQLPISLDAAYRQEWSALECLRALYRRKAALLSITGAGILTAGLIGLLQSPRYQSVASLEVEGVNENFLNARDVYPTVTSGPDLSGTYVQTQAEILQQDALIDQVVNELNLASRPEFQARQRAWGRSHAAGDDAISVRVANERHAAEVVKRIVKVVPSRGSRIIRIVCEARDPQTAADLANAFGRTFIEQSTEARRRTAEQTLASLSLEREKLRKRILQSEALLQGGATISGLPGASHHSDANPSPATTLRVRDLESDRRFYATMSQRVNDASVAATIQPPSMRLVGSAQPASRPYKPNLSLNLTIGMFGGLILGIGWVMFREQSSCLLRMPGEAGMYLTLPELGVIPKTSNPSLVRHCWSLSGPAKPMVNFADTPQHLAELSESFRSTLASILSSSQNGDHPHTLVVTSAQPMEGKTTVVSNLAIRLTEIGRKVLLIDGDMRRPRLHKLFNVANSWGLSDILREENDIESLPLDVLVKKTGVLGLYLLPSGVMVDNIFGLLWSGRMARLLPRFRQEFDYVLLDAPPCLEYADARILARHADELLLVVRADYTDRRTAQVAVQRLQRDGISVMGVILNRCNWNHSDGYGYAFHNSPNH